MDILPSMYQVAYDLGYKASISTQISSNPDKQLEYSINPYDIDVERQQYDSWQEGYDDGLDSLFE